MFETGFVGFNKQGLEFIVLDGTLSHKTLIQFKVDNVQVTTTKSYLKSGLPLHPTHGKVLVGSIFEDKNGEKFKIVALGGDWGYTIEYLKDGYTCKRDKRSVKANTGYHPDSVTLKVGTKYEVHSGVITVVEFINSINVVVAFEDGTQTKTTVAAIKNKNVGHPSSKLHVGQKFTTNSGWSGEVTYYNNPRSVGVLWQDGSRSEHPASHISKGAIKPLFQPSVLGVGYMGDGRFTSSLKNSGEDAPAEILSYWQRMISRCFNPKEILKNTGRRYIHTGVHKDWFNFQNFAEWAIREPNYNMKFDLDKDLLGEGLEYSPDNCCFLPTEVNVFLAENWTKDTHNLPIGVQYLKARTSGSKVGYVSRCHTEKGREYLGYFDDPMDAYRAYKAKKEEFAKTLAEKYKNVITERAYAALKAFEITKIYPTDYSTSCDTLED